MSKKELDIEKKEFDEAKIRQLVKEAALASYGVKKIANEVDKKGNSEDYIFVRIHKEYFDVELHVDVANGIKVTEILRSCRKTINTVLNHAYPKGCHSIDIYAENLLDK